MPDRRSTPSTQVRLSLPSDLVERFDKLAKICNRSRAWIVERALRQYLNAEGAESLAQLDRGEGEPLVTIFGEIEQIIANASDRKALLEASPEALTALSKRLDAPPRPNAKLRRLMKTRPPWE